MNKILAWLNKDKNFVILAGVCTCFWALFTYFNTNQSEKSLHNSTSLTGNTFNNSPVQIEQNNINGYTAEQYNKNLNEDLASRKKDWERANGAEKALISLQLSAIQEKQFNLQKSYQDTLAENQKLNLALNEFKTKNLKITTQQFIDAQSALQRGDSSKADIVFKEIENAENEHIASAANAAYQRARIANNAFRWKDALELASKANHLYPKSELYTSFYATLLLNTGDSLQAEKLYEQSLQLAINKYGTNSLEAANQHSGLAEAYKTSNFELAESHNLKAIEIAKAPRKDAPINSLFLGNLYSNLATLYQENGKYSESEINQLKAIAIHEKALPANHPDLSIDYNNLAGLYRLQGKLNEAEKYQLKSIAIDEKALPVGHPSLPRHYDNLAQIYMLKGSKPIDMPSLLKAKLFLLKAIGLLEKYPPPVESNVGSTYLNLGFTYIFMQDYKAAEPYFAKAADIAVKYFGVSDGRTQTAIQNYIVCLKKQNKNIGSALKKYGLGVRPLIVNDLSH